MDSEDSLQDGPVAKRLRLCLNRDSKTAFKPKHTVPAYTRSSLRSLDRAISPPARKLANSASSVPLASSTITEYKNEDKKRGCKTLPSPIQLTCIRDLPADHNVDTVGLKDILGDPMIKECWQFNYLFNLDFLMGALDEDVRDIVQVKVIHGSWKKEDTHRLRLEKSSKRYPNIQLITAHMPEPFGTHHCKMMILIRHDDTAQIVIHTANMIPQDWANLTQAVWRSPLLPLLTPSSESASASASAPASSFSKPQPIGSSPRFKSDLLRYLSAYGSRLRALTSQLQHYDFSPVRAAFLASVPSRVRLAAADPGRYTAWGWPGLREILDCVPVAPQKEPASLVMQVSSIATLGATDKWLGFFRSVLARHAPGSGDVSGAIAVGEDAERSSGGAGSGSRDSKEKGSASASASAKGTARGTVHAKTTKTATAITTPPPTLHLIFPTAHEIRHSLDGYASGASIHLKLHSAAHQAQLRYLRPLLCRWSSAAAAPSAKPPSLRSEAEPSNPPPISSPTAPAPSQALRGAAAPHIKTYVRFSSTAATSIDWALVSSANLSTQAWGALEGADGVVRVCSWEVGVLVWPALFADPGAGEGEVGMVPVFRGDWPGDNDGDGDGDGDGDEAVGGAEEGGGSGGRASSGLFGTLVGLRLPYDLPLTPYARDDVPWCATAVHEEPDWRGKVWG